MFPSLNRHILTCVDSKQYMTRKINIKWKTNLLSPVPILSHIRQNLILSKMIQKICTRTPA